MKRRGLGTWIFVSAILVGAIGLSLGYDYLERIGNLPVYGPKEEMDGVVVDFTVPEYRLVAQDGGVFSSNAIRGTVTVTNFFFTSCPSICPKMMRNLQSVHELYRNDPQVAFVSMTVDPERDTPERLEHYAEMLNANTKSWRFLTGEKKEIYRLARNSFFVTASAGDGGNLDFIHSENLVLTDRQGRIRGYYNGLDESAMETLSGDILKLKNERS